MGAVPPTISFLLGKSTDYLKGRGSTSPRLDAELLLAEVTGMNRVELYINFEQPLNTTEVDHYRELVRRRGKGEPVAYILGRAYFRNLALRVDRSTLVPRPETEHLVETGLTFLGGLHWSTGPPQVLDIGTGSGAIALAIAAECPAAAVTAVDSNQAALRLAADNARLAGLATRLVFIQSDLFAELDPLHTFDLILSNPPYIASGEWESLPLDVREYEPRESLYGGEDGLDCYRRIIAEAHQFLKPGGCLAFEIGYRQGAELKRLLIDADRYRGISISKDYAGLDRVISALKVD